MNKLEISSFTLHLLAMSLMFCDHLWASIIPGAMWLNYIGRIAFPIFAYMLIEGFYLTKDLKKYMLRILVFALISEIPFNLIAGADFFYPFYQNVLWNFLISLLCISIIEKIKRKNNLILTILTIVTISFLGFIVATFLMVDYYGYGVLMVMVFYVFKGRKWWQILLQIICMFYINVILLGGRTIPINLFGLLIEFPTQGFAMLAFIPILLYRGKQGPYNKTIKYLYYSFYPLHLLILSIIALYM